ncbi:UDP-N-acetylmuramoyl-L-alanine--D-glutamate ligase [Zophobihabitans entericus]|uniref:UDP-N-acetylmuramoylalanine--D-glutamate ligase n=1 Tax=Zophobihabitans entericus TaxID=1635327 RepID=A0A6G9IBL2_9GAMM|nr:UDP-N-acetylmuramoyl-L-alanine--D-glutamate ligase [Zophobihabitans entericus]QIQ20970.1 UDP-N-acetylmuramoyl-L-alanine--D-glutamate ligase [Zophobihabitans entericus]
MNYQGKNIVIIGLGITGLSCVNYFLAQGVIPKVIDTRTEPAGLDKLDKRVAYHLGSLRLDWLLEADLIVSSPGIALATPELQKAAEQGVEIVGDIELFCREVNKLGNKKIAAITGANGKTTVTTLVGEIVKASGISVGVGGNIGQDALSLLEHDYDIYVLELSSFQLETTSSLKATVATILNITEDHMDRYPLGIAQYTAAKQRIYHQAMHCLINADDPLTVPETGFSDRCIEFGLHQGDYSLDTRYQHLLVDGEAVFDTADMQLIGLHNYTNALAALAIADKLGIDRAVTYSVLKQFKGLPHRFELVHEHRGVRWINDSKATNVGSTEAALRSLVYQGHLYLLLGGDGKAADFSPLIPYLQKDNITIYSFGRDRQLLAKLKPESTVVVETMAEAMKEIATKVKPDDVVLLSPACASLDQFKNYVERGNVFAQLAKEFDA